MRYVLDLRLKRRIYVVEVDHSNFEGGGEEGVNCDNCYPASRDRKLKKKLKVFVTLVVALACILTK